MGVGEINISFNVEENRNCKDWPGDLEQLLASGGDLGRNLKIWYVVNHFDGEYVCFTINAVIEEKKRRDLLKSLLKEWQKGVEDRTPFRLDR